MCGIVGYIADENVTGVIIEGLKKLEYRGYDSAGIALCGHENNLLVRKKKGRISNLEDLIREENLFSHTGIGHTRWATHGEPSDRNSHPHTDMSGRIAVVHNGIIENFAELKEELIEKMIEKLIKATDANNEAFKALYEAAFPPEEQIP